MNQSPNFIRVVSDLHLDFDVLAKNSSVENLWFPEELPFDDNTILIVAGDIWHAKKPLSYKGFSWLKEISKRFKYIVLVLGNHDFWGGNLNLEYLRYSKFIQENKLENVFLLQNNTIKFENLKIIGGTLWTDYLKGNAICMNLAENGLMNDYKFIKKGNGFFKLKAKDLLYEHLKTKQYINENAKKENKENLWVITHHLPTIASIPIDRGTEEQEIENGLYYSDLEEIIQHNPIDVWVHGHSHNYQYYELYNTKIIANPRGYKNEDTGFNPWIVYDLAGKIINIE